MCQLQDSYCAIVVCFERLKQRVTKIYAGCTVDNNIQIFDYFCSHFRVHTQVLKREIALYSDDSFSNYFSQLWSFFLQDLKNVTAENFILETFLKCHPLFGPHEDIYFLEIRTGSQYFFKDNFCEVACAPRHQN